MAFEEGAGVAEILFGVGCGASETVKRFVEDADDAALFGKRLRILDYEFLKLGLCDCLSWKSASSGETRSLVFL
jgi:hypothetical protein